MSPITAADIPDYTPHISLERARAAAPDMLAALRHAESVLAVPSSDPRVARTALARIRAAIAKAEGKE